MIVIAGLVIGGFWGGLSAKKRGGRPADIAQYAAVYAIALAIVGVFLTIIIDRSLR